MRKVIFILSIVVIGGLALAACAQGEQPSTSADQPNVDLPTTYIEKTLYVGPQLVDCTGVAPQKCMLVKEDPAADYTLLYDPIEGFTFEEGFNYQLLVREEQVANPPADASSIKLALIEMVSRSAAASTLEGVLWEVTSFLDTAGEMAAVTPGSMITARFEKGQLSGQACNRYFGDYQTSGDQLSIGVIGSTDMFCSEPETIMDQEGQYLAALQKAATYTVTGGKLTIFDASGKVLVEYAETESTALVGTNWIMTAYNNGNQAVQSGLAGIDVTALFAEDLTLTGFAGCNNYNASYKVEGSNLTIGPAASTRMMCAEPAGVMEQESAYLASLALAATYQIELDTLTIRGAEDQMLAIYTAQK